MEAAPSASGPLPASTPAAAPVPAGPGPAVAAPKLPGAPVPTAPANSNSYAGYHLGVPASALEAATSMNPKDYVWGTAAVKGGAPGAAPGVHPPMYAPMQGVYAHPHALPHSAAAGMAFPPAAYPHPAAGAHLAYPGALGVPHYPAGVPGPHPGQYYAPAVLPAYGAPPSSLPPAVPAATAPAAPASFSTAGPTAPAPPASMPAVGPAGAASCSGLPAVPAPVSPGKPDSTLSSDTGDAGDAGAGEPGGLDDAVLCLDGLDELFGEGDNRGLDGLDWPGLDSDLSCDSKLVAELPKTPVRKVKGGTKKTKSTATALSGPLAGMPLPTALEAIRSFLSASTSLPAAGRRAAAEAVAALIPGVSATGGAPAVKKTKKSKAAPKRTAKAAAAAAAPAATPAATTAAATAAP